MAASITDSDGRAAAVERACDYALSSFSSRLGEIERLRNRALIALGLLSAASAFLVAENAAERLAPVLWLPAILFGVTLTLALPPLMSVSIVYPVRLRKLREHVDKHSRAEITEALLRDSASADEFGQRLCAATAVYTDNALRVAVLGLSATVMPVAASSMDVRVAVWTGLGAGIVVLVLVEFGRRALRLSVDTGS